MADIDYDALIADRAAGTEGPWMAVMCDPESGEENYDTVLADAGLHGVFGLAYINHFFSGHEANARRIARVPALEAAVLALREENQRLQREAIAAEARGLERAAKLCSETRDEALEASGIEGRVIASWFSAQAEAIRAQATALRKALEQEQGNV